MFNRIIQSDCIAGMKKLRTGSVDLVFADPPFNIGYDYDTYDDKRACGDYLDWSKQWIGAAKRALKPDGTFWLAIGDEYAAELKVMCTRELGFHCRSWVIWYYTFGVHCKQKFTRSHAHLFQFVKDAKKFTFNAKDIRVPSARQLVYGDKRAVEGGRSPDDTWMMTPVLPPEVSTRDGFILRPQDIPERFPGESDTWFYSRVAGTFKERQGFHGCQMPEQLLGRIIRASSNEGEVVLDPFGGSGTTLAVAKKLKREYLGFELSKQYVTMIKKRLAASKAGAPLEGPENAALSAPKTKRGRRLPLKPSVATPRVSKSPVVSKANLSLGQVAVANGELATAVAEAFMASHQGYSADRVIADPKINDAFLHNCRSLGIPGSERDWNHLLLNVRKRSGLSAIDTSRRTTIRRPQMEQFNFASEIAWKRLSDIHGCSLDEILCAPSLSEKFFEIASSIAPGFTAFDFRWSALSVRKFATRGRSLWGKVDRNLERTRRFQDFHRLAESPAHYLLHARQKPFFVGYASSLRQCPLLQPRPLMAAVEAMNLSLSNETDLTVRVRPFEEQENWNMACRARLLKDFKPPANVPIPNVPIPNEAA